MTGSEKLRALISGATSGISGVGAIIQQKPCRIASVRCLTIYMTKAIIRARPKQVLLPIDSPNQSAYKVTILLILERRTLYACRI